MDGDDTAGTANEVRALVRYEDPVNLHTSTNTHYYKHIHTNTNTNSGTWSYGFPPVY